MKKVIPQSKVKKLLISAKAANPRRNKNITLPKITMDKK